MLSTQLKFARGKGADRGRHGRFRADRDRLGRGRKFGPVIGADLGPVGFDRYFGRNQLGLNRYRLPAQIFVRGLAYPYRPEIGRVVYKGQVRAKFRFDDVTSGFRFRFRFR